MSEDVPGTEETPHEDGLDEAVDDVVAAVMEHLALLRAGHQATDDEVVAANLRIAQASAAYDEKLVEAYGDVTPWGTAEEEEGPRRRPVTQEELAEIAVELPSEDRDGMWVAVRMRADYWVEDLEALLDAAHTRAQTLGEDAPPVVTVGDAFAALLATSDEPIAAFAIDELSRGNGVTLVHEPERPLMTDMGGEEPYDPLADFVTPFATGRERLLAVLPDLVPDDEDEDGTTGAAGVADVNETADGAVVEATEDTTGDEIADDDEPGAVAEPVSDGERAEKRRGLFGRRRD